jgi:hypothetical protein
VFKILTGLDLVGWSADFCDDSLALLLQEVLKLIPRGAVHLRNCVDRKGYPIGPGHEPTSWR